MEFFILQILALMVREVIIYLVLIVSIKEQMFVIVVNLVIM